MGSELAKSEKKDKEKPNQGLCRTGEQAKQGNELPKESGISIPGLFWERGGTSLIQVV